MNERDIFVQALEMSDAATQAAFLDDACGADESLRLLVVDNALVAGQAKVHRHGRRPSKTRNDLVHPARGKIEARRALPQRERIAPEELLPLRVAREQLGIVERYVERLAGFVEHREPDFGPEFLRGVHDRLAE